jgi:hypothetical protein
MHRLVVTFELIFADEAISLAVVFAAKDGTLGLSIFIAVFAGTVA